MSCPENDRFFEQQKEIIEERMSRIQDLMEKAVENYENAYLLAQEAVKKAMKELEALKNNQKELL